MNILERLVCQPLVLKQHTLPVMQLTLSTDESTCNIPSGIIRGNYDVSHLKHGLRGSLLRLQESSGKGEVIAKGPRKHSILSEIEAFIDEGITLRRREQKALIAEGATLLEMEKMGACVPHVIGYGITSKKEAYMLMGEVKGQSAEDLLIEFDQRSGKTLPLSIVARIVEPTLYTLKIARKLRLAYRDLKPSNIQVTDDGRVILLDWEAQHKIGMRREISSGTEVFTEGYSAPEMLDISRPTDERTDVYSMAATITTLVTGRILSSNVRASRIINRYLSSDYPELAKVLLQAVSKYSERYHTIDDFRNALRNTELYADKDMPPFNASNFKEILAEQLANKLAERE